MADNCSNGAMALVAAAVEAAVRAGAPRRTVAAVAGAAISAALAAGMATQAQPLEDKKGEMADSKPKDGQRKRRRRRKKTTEQADEENITDKQNIETSTDQWAQQNDIVMVDQASTQKNSHDMKDAGVATTCSQCVREGSEYVVCIEKRIMRARPSCSTPAAARAQEGVRRGKLAVP